MLNQVVATRRRVVVTGLGAVTPLGLTAGVNWEALRAGRSGIGPITRFDAALCTARIAGEVRGFEPTAALPAPLRPRGRRARRWRAPSRRRTRRSSAASPISARRRRSRPTRTRGSMRTATGWMPPGWA